MYKDLCLICRSAFKHFSLLFFNVLILLFLLSFLKIFIFSLNVIVNWRIMAVRCISFSAFRVKMPLLYFKVVLFAKYEELVLSSPCAKARVCSFFVPCIAMKKIQRNFTFKFYLFMYITVFIQAMSFSSHLYLHL